ncbi:MAG: hypothetical protein EOP06_07395 [Proteobacteria bacterium]|nr:MAG: hypothetical protein EOP06_07395 [Pseudomonadota bacterium]
MDIIYQVNLGFSINDVTITWGMPRGKVRELLMKDFKEDNATLDFSEIFAKTEDDDFDFSQRRDIYSGLVNEGDSIFMLYDDEDRLSEFEVHENISVSISDFRLYSGQPLEEILEWADNEEYGLEQSEPGNYIIPELKITFADFNAMGGNDDGLAYFYASADVSHLS